MHFYMLYIILHFHFCFLSLNLISMFAVTGNNILIVLLYMIGTRYQRVLCFSSTFTHKMMKNNAILSTVYRKLIIINELVSMIMNQYTINNDVCHILGIWNSLSKFVAVKINAYYRHVIWISMPVINKLMLSEWFSTVLQI